MTTSATLHRDTPIEECPAPTACWWHGREHRAQVNAQRAAERSTAEWTCPDCGETELAAYAGLHRSLGCKPAYHPGVAGEIL